MAFIVRVAHDPSYLMLRLRLIPQANSGRLRALLLATALVARVSRVILLSLLMSFLLLLEK
jgi:hypothetical protein